MKLKDWKDVIDFDWPRHQITDETIAYNMVMATHYRSSARIATGRLYADNHYEIRRQKILSTPLP